MSETPTTWSHQPVEGEPANGLSLATLKQMAADGRISGRDLIVNEASGESYEAGVIEDLGMVWLISIEEDDWSPPCHPLALVAPLEAGDLDPDTVVRHVESGDEFAASDIVCAVLIEQNRLLKDVLDETTREMEKAAAAIEPPPPEDLGDATSAAAPNSPADWQRLMKQKDVLEREVSKWRKFYDDEIERNASKEAALVKRLDQSKNLEQQIEARYNLLRESKERLDEENERLKASLREGEGDRPEAISIQEISRSTRELENQLSLIESQLEDRNRLINDLYEERDRIEKETEERISRIESSLRRERDEASRLRMQTMELEHKHQELLKSYREINERLITMRNAGAPLRSAAPSEQPAPAAGDDAPAEKSSGGSRSRIKMR